MQERAENAVDQQRACAADAGSAADMGSGEIVRLPQEIGEARARLDLCAQGTAVDDERDRRHWLSARSWARVRATKCRHVKTIHSGAAWRAVNLTGDLRTRRDASPGNDRANLYSSRRRSKTWQKKVIHRSRKSYRDRLNRTSCRDRRSR